MTNLSQTLKAFREKILPPPKDDIKEMIALREIIGEKVTATEIRLYSQSYEHLVKKYKEIEEFIAESIKSACEEMIVEEKNWDDWIRDENGLEGYKCARQDQLERLKNILG